MKTTEQVKCLVVDTGLFVHLARRLARDFERVYYWSPWETAFPYVKDAVIGDGYPDIVRVESICQVKDQCDLFFFPDIGFADLQVELAAQGRAVWGCRHGDELEARRGKFLQTLATETDLPVPKYQKLKGLTNLRLFLVDNPDRYIKVSTYRGDFETFHFRSVEEDGHELDEWGVKLGPLREQINFYVFEPIDTEIEDGIDAYCIDGQWPQTILHGMEWKNSAYIGAFQKLADTAPELRCVNEAFGPILAKYGYRGAFSTEVRITPEGESYFIDPTCRFPSPPSQVMCEIMGNFGDIIWYGANGIMVEPEPVARFGVQAIFKANRSEWNTYKIPEELDPWVKVSFSCKIGELICVPPGPLDSPEIGWVTAIGDDLESTIATLKERVGEMPEGCHVEVSSLADLLKEMQAAEEVGVELTDQPIPEPAIILED